MSNVIYLRYWDGREVSKPFELKNISSLLMACLSHGHDIKFMKPIGLKDKHENDIFESDLLRVKHRMGEEKENWFVDAVYEVMPVSYEGLRLHFRRNYYPLNTLVDGVLHQLPINQTMSWKYGHLNTDYINSNYDNISISETNNSNHLSGRTWKENWYSNDIEIIGNIYQNPELLSQ